MKKFLLISIFIIFIICLNFLGAASETDILIVSDDDAYPWYDEITSVTYYQEIINNKNNGNNISYNISIWNQSSSGSPSLVYLQSFGLVIWTTGPFFGNAPSSLDIITLENYVNSGGKLIISGTYILYDWRENSFTNNVLHASNSLSPYSSDLDDINITNSSHTIFTGFSNNEILTFISSPGAYNYDPDAIDSAVGDGQVVAVRGPSASNVGDPAIITFENSSSGAKVVFISFPIFLLNQTNRTNIIENSLYWMDGYAPTINNINLIPSDDENDLDPDVQINFTINATDLHNVSSLKLSYKCAAGAGSCSPGTEEFTNITMDYNSTDYLFENASFTPDVPGIWQYKIWSNDTIGNEGFTQIYNLSIEYDYTWSRDPSNFSTVSCFFSENCTLGNITLNNTGDFSLDFDLSSNYQDIYYNETTPFTLSSGETKVIQVNATAGEAPAENNIAININSTSSNANPSFYYTNVTFISFAGGAYLSNTLIDYTTTINQSNLINLSGSVENVGNETATNTFLNWSFPSSSWLNSSGNITQNISNLSAGSTEYNNISIDISTDISAGIYTIYLNSSCENDVVGCSDLESFNLIVSCNSTDNVCGSGCTYQTDDDCPTETIIEGSGGGGGSSKTQRIEFSEIIEILRGREHIFEIEVKNTFKDTTLENLSLEIVGFSSQYLEIQPKEISKIDYNSSEFFKIKIKIPSYEEVQTFILNTTILGIKRTPITNVKYSKTSHIKLIVQEVEQEESNFTLLEAEKAIEMMISKGFNVKELEKLLEEAKEKLENKENKAAQDLAKEIINTKEKAFLIDELISKIKRVLENPRDINILTGSVVKNFEGSRYITGNAVLTDSSSEEILNLAIAAFQRGDYDLAEERAKSVQVLLLLERKGNPLWFFYLYWYFILFGAAIFFIAGNATYKKYQKSNISKNINKNNSEESHIQKLMIENQRKYFSKEISVSEYQKSKNQNLKRLASLKKERISLRNKRVKFLNFQRIVLDLKGEIIQVENEIKEIQRGYYEEKNVSKKEYDLQFKILNERLAEIENEHTILEISKKNKEKVKQIKSKDIIQKGQKIAKDPKSSSNFAKKLKSSLSKLKKDERGVMFIDSKIIDLLKEHTKEKDCKNKWIHLKYKGEENESRK